MGLYNLQLSIDQIKTNNLKIKRALKQKKNCINFSCSRSNKVQYQPPYDGKSYHNASHYSWAAINKTTIEQKPLIDQKTLRHAKKFLQDFAKQEGTNTQPLFMAVGFRKPHTPLIFPEEFLQFYPEEDIHLAAFRDLPKNFPPVAWNPK